MLFTLMPAAVSADYGEQLVPLASVKAWLRVDHDDEDELLAMLRDSSIDLIEQYSNLSLGPTVDREAWFDGFGARMRVGVGPVAGLSVTGIEYVDANGEDASIDAGGWRVDASGGLIPAGGASWPSGAMSVTVKFAAGFPAGRCPAALKQAVMMFAAYLYENREALAVSGMTGEVPPGVEAICQRYRMPVL
ncbi:MAG: hypothetical protein CMN72_09655 [Sphingomonas sp.]|nr:hypothetical protein [Sphingomonas sp.]